VDLFFTCFAFFLYLFFSISLSLLRLSSGCYGIIRCCICVQQLYNSMPHSQTYETKRNTVLYTTQICLFNKWVVMVVVVVRMMMIMTIMATTVQKKMNSLWYIVSS